MTAADRVIMPQANLEAGTILQREILEISPAMGEQSRHENTSTGLTTTEAGIITTRGDEIIRTITTGSRLIG